MRGFICDNRAGSPFLITYGSVLSILVRAATLTQRDALVPAEDQTVVADTALHAGQVAGVSGALGLLATGLGAGRAAWSVMTARGAF